MSANLFGERFYSNRQVPWHLLGIVSERENTAVEALGLMGDYTVELRKLMALGDPKDPDCPALTLPERVIIRRPTKDDPDFQDFGIVGPEYELITPRDATLIWDKSVKRPVETIGALGGGQTLFISTQMPSVSIGGDEVEGYLLLVSPMIPGASLQVRVTPIRVVCQNTLIAAKQMTTELYQIRHDRHAREYLATWLEGVYTKGVAKFKALKEVFDVFTKVRLETEDVDEILGQVYPVPPKPKVVASPEVMERRMGYWEENRNGALRQQVAVKQLYSGEAIATGFEKGQFAGTAWRMYNSVTEWECHRDSRGKIFSAAHNTLFGDRAEAIERCFDALHSFSEN